MGTRGKEATAIVMQMELAIITVADRETTMELALDSTGKRPYQTARCNSQRGASP
jgi:hypothetical protein